MCAAGMHGIGGKGIFLTMKIGCEHGQILSLRPGEYFKMTGIKFPIGIFPLDMLKPLKNSRIFNFSYEKVIKNQIGL